MPNAGRGPADELSPMRRALLIPRVAKLGASAPRDPLRAWSLYWSEIEATGDDGQVLWDSTDGAEREFYRRMLVEHLDPGLPIVDVGCGNGRFARWLTAYAPRVRGVDVSPEAVELARQEARAESMGPELDFAVLDATDVAAAQRMRAELGDCNVFVRGVFHVLNGPDQRRMAATARALVGARGGMLLGETNFPGSSLAYLQHLGAGPMRFPSQLERAVRRLPRPGHFGSAELRAAMEPGQWELLAEGEVMIRTVPMRNPGTPEQIPGYYAVVRPTRT